MEPSFIAAIYLFAGNFAPQNFMLCQGQLIAISQNDALFNLIGTTYGGDGVNTFGLPDLRGRVPIHQGTGTGLSTYVMGQMAGNENITFTTQQMPSHTHAINVSSATATTPTPTASTYLGAVVNGAAAENVYSINASNSTLASSSVGVNSGGQPFSLIQPVLALNYIITLYGIYPTQN